MKATINTKSNYKNLNGKTFEVAEIVGNRVTVIIHEPTAYKGRLLTDFTRSEVDLNKNPHDTPTRGMMGVSGRSLIGY